MKNNQLTLGFTHTRASKAMQQHEPLFASLPSWIDEFARNAEKRRAEKKQIVDYEPQSEIKPSKR